MQCSLCHEDTSEKGDKLRAHIIIENCQDALWVGGQFQGKSRGSGGIPFLMTWLIKDNAIEAKTEGGAVEASSR